MKKYLFLLTSIFILTACGAKEIGDEPTDPTLIVSPTQKCESNLNKIDDNLYLYCLENVTLKKGDFYIDLPQILKQNVITKEDLLSVMETVSDTNIYRLYQKNDYRILICHNKWIIGTKQLEYNEELCQIPSENTDCKFTKTFQVIAILNEYVGNDENFIHIVLDRATKLEPTVVKIKRTLASNLEVGKYYEVTFHHTTEVSNNNSIASLFETYPILNITYTDKTPINQIQEAICN